MVRRTDVEMTVMKKEADTHSLKARGTACQPEPHREAPGAFESEGKACCEPLVCFLWEAMAKQGRVNGLGRLRIVHVE